MIKRSRQARLLLIYWTLVVKNDKVTAYGEKS
jgi:hypothetical protein